MVAARAAAEGRRVMGDAKDLMEAIQSMARGTIGDAMDACAWSHDGDGWRITVDGACPVQGEGFVDGLPMYYRSRHCEWSFCIAAAPDGDPVGVGLGYGPDVAGWRFEGDDGGEGWTTADESRPIVEACIAAWRARVDRSTPTTVRRMELPSVVGDG